MSAGETCSGSFLDHSHPANVLPVPGNPPIRETCGAQEWGRNDDGSVHIYGTCTLPLGHPTGWHQEVRDSRVWAEWRGPAEERAPDA